MASIGGFFRSIALIWQLGDSLAPLLATLSNTLPSTGDAMIASGQGAVGVSKALRADGGLPINAQSTVDSLKESIRQSRGLVGDTERTFRQTADAIKAIKVPAVVFQTTQLDLGPLGKYNFATGMSVTEVSPFQPVHDGLDAVAAMLHDINDHLLENQQALRDLSTVLATTGSGLATLGEGLQTSGELLKGGHA